MVEASAISQSAQVLPGDSQALGSLFVQSSHNIIMIFIFLSKVEIIMIIKGWACDDNSCMQLNYKWEH